MIQRTLIRRPITLLQMQESERRAIAVDGGVAEHIHNFERLKIWLVSTKLLYCTTSCSKRIATLRIKRAIYLQDPQSFPNSLEFERTSSCVHSNNELYRIDFAR